MNCAMRLDLCSAARISRTLTVPSSAPMTLEGEACRKSGDAILGKSAVSSGNTSRGIPHRDSVDTMTPRTDGKHACTSR
jgi:hypothetical protein